MFYNNLKTHVLEPNSHTKKRTEFKLRHPNMLLTTNWRLVDMGAVLQLDDSVGTYNASLGNFNIKNLYLYDGKVELTKLTEAKDFIAFLNRNRTNDACINLKVLDGTNLGFSVSSGATSGQLYQDTQVFYNNTSNLAVPDEDLTARSYLSLQRYLPLLGALTFMHTGIFKDLRLVLEYDFADSFQRNETEPEIIVTEPLIPKLVFEQVLNDQVANTMLQDFFKNPIVWNEIENERFFMPAPTNILDTVQTQQLNVRSTGFLNKTLNRVMIKKRVTTVDSDTYRKQISQNLFNEKLNVIVNGRQFLPDDGINCSAYRSGLLSDTWGAMCVTGVSNLLGIDPVVTSADNFFNNNTSSYVGFSVGKKINDLQLNVSRDYKNSLDATLNGSVEIKMFGEVQKTMVPDKFVGYQIIYL